jgi:two-component system LytT family response regulator
MQNYVTIYSTRGKYVTMLSLKNLEEKMAGNAFIRVHKSFIAAISKIDGIEAGELFIGNSRIPISRTYRDQVIEQVVSKRLWDKK